MPVNVAIIISPNSAAAREAASFPYTWEEKGPMLNKLVHYLIARERLTQQVMDFLQTLAV